MFRPVILPLHVPGQLFLSAMPGRYGPFDEESQLIADFEIDLVVCLASLEEIRQKAPGYADAIVRDALAWPWRHFPVEDYGVPDDPEAFLALAKDIARRLEAGEQVLIHCAAGIGRTGTLGALALMALGMGRGAALRAIEDAGGHPEVNAQKELIKWAEIRLTNGNRS